MSIADKITSIEGHLTADYEGLENLGADLTNVNKNIQNIRTCLDNIYDNLPKTTGEGSNLSLTTLKGRINVEAVKGDTTQEGTPTPSNVEDINVVTGDNTIKVESKNLFDKDTFHIGDIKQNDTTIRMTSWQNLYLEAGTYTFSWNGTSPFRYAIQGQTIGQPPLSTYPTFNYNSGWQTSSSYTFTLSTSMWIDICISKNNNATLTLEETKALSYQIEKGTTATSYVEHQEQTKTLHLGDIELAKIGTYQDRISKSSGKNLFDKDNAQILNAFVNGSSGLLATPTNSQKSIAVAIQPNTQYTISGVERSSSNYGLFSDETLTIGTSIATTKGNINNGTMTFTSGANDKWLVFLLGGGSETYGYNKVMLNEGSTALPYEPYGSDKWYIEKNIGKVANKTWTVGSMVSNNRCSIPLNINGLADTINSYNGINCISNCLIATSQGTQATSTDINTISINNANTYVKFDDATNTKELVKAKLDSMTNFVLYYILITPTYEEITNTTLLEELNELEKMMSYNGQTNISVSSNLPMILDVSALKGE